MNLPFVSAYFLRFNPPDGDSSPRDVRRMKPISVTVTQQRALGGAVGPARLGSACTACLGVHVRSDHSEHSEHSDQQLCPRGAAGAREAVLPQPVVAQDVGGGGRDPGPRQGSAGRSVRVSELQC